MVEILSVDFLLHSAHIYPMHSLSQDDRLYVFEAVGLLLGQEEIAAEEQQAMLSALLQPLREQVGST